MNAPPPPCAGLWKLLDSVDPVDHKEAAALCQTCPIVAHCREQLEAARASMYTPTYGPKGTWAGELIGAGATQRHFTERARREEEEALYTEAEARNCAVRWQNGEHNDYTKIGRRVYERRGQRMRDARKAAAA